MYAIAEMTAAAAGIGPLFTATGDAFAPGDLQRLTWPQRRRCCRDYLE
jgi:hypothetical protein